MDGFSMTYWLDQFRSRRTLLRTGLLVPIGWVGAVVSPAWAQRSASPTPACSDTPPAQMEGPYFRPNSPERTSLLEPGMRGTKLVLTGYVLSAACKPVVRALLDFWHADDRGAYDNAGFRLRGHQFTDEHGHYVLETIIPGVYAGRTRHIHVKLQPPQGPLLTTQLYFPDEPRNVSDSLFRSKLLIGVRADVSATLGRFDFVTT
jgi:protocatechuate 3,4-dioxygenase beta subunit